MQCIVDKQLLCQSYDEHSILHNQHHPLLLQVYSDYLPVLQSYLERMMLH